MNRRQRTGLRIMKLGVQITLGVILGVFVAVVIAAATSH